MLSLVLSLFVAPPARAQDYAASAASARKLIEAIVRADTSNPPGNEARAAAIGAARLREAGIEPTVTEFAPGRQNLVARLRGSGKARPLLLLAHTDVVGTDGQTWTSPPHQPAERDGYLFGRGVLDDLGMGAIEMETLILLKKSGRRLKRDVILAWTGDEESGGEGIKKILKEDRGLVDAEFALNEGGGAALGPDGKVRWVEVQLGEKTYQDYVLTARGTTGHSSVPQPDNAIYRLARALDRLGRYRIPPRLLPVTKAYLAARARFEPPRVAEAMRAVAASTGTLPEAALAVLEEDPSLSATLRTTCVATTIQGGTRVNALPAEASANVNCRILPDESAETVKAMLAKVIDDPAIELKVDGDYANSSSSPLESPVVAAVGKAAAKVWPGAPVIPIVSRGASDSRHLRAAGIPAYGIDPVAVLEQHARLAHGIDERIPLASLRPGVEFLHRIVLELAAE